MMLGYRRRAVRRLRLKFCATDLKEFSSREPVLAIYPQARETFPDDAFSVLPARQRRKLPSILKNSYLIG
jgi:hypothetical protein